MKSSVLLGVAGVASAVVVLGQFTDANPTGPASDRDLLAAVDTAYEVLPQGGTPDVIVWEISGVANYSQGEMRAYSVGTTSCNIGDVPLNWFANNNQHPVIGQNMYRLAPGANGHLRFEHLGQSWLKHGFCALSQPDCGDCQPTNCDTLGVGCSDPYTASRNGTQSTAGPKYQVNTTTGFFPYPPANPSYSGSVARRLQVHEDEMIPGMNPGATWYVEAQYVTSDDNPSVDIIRAANNVSWRQASITDTGSMNGYLTETMRQEPAVYAWKAEDPTVDVQWRAITGEGSYYLASQAYDNGDGTWDYEYALFNLDSDRSAGGITFNVDESVTVTSEGFNDVHYHSGELWNGTDWVSNRVGDTLTWNTTQTYAENTQANAIRWGTMYNFRFTADSGPVNGDIDVSFFKPGDGGDGFSITGKVPQSLNICLGDFNDDGVVGFADLTSLLAEWGFCFNCPQDFDGNFNVNFEDLVTLLSAWGPCP